MIFKYLGQSGFQLNIGNKSIVFDPFISPNEKASSISLDEIHCDLLLQSHAHEDHIADSLQIAKSTGAQVVSCFETITWFEKHGITNTHPMNIGGNWDFGFAKIKMVNAVHSNSFPDGTYAGNACGWVIQAEDKVIYYAGDTALTYDMKLIAEEFEVDYALLPIGDNFTMGYKDAAKAAEFVQTKKVIGMHYDTFGYIEIDHAAVLEYFKSRNIELNLIRINDTIEL